MSFYSFSITTPANTAVTSKQKTTLKLEVGIIHKVQIRIPAGQQGLCHCYIQQGLHQIAPKNPGGDFHGDDEKIEYSEYYELKRGLTDLVVFTWNTDDTYAREIIVSLGILRKKYLPQAYFERAEVEKGMIAQSLEKLSKWIGGF